MCVPTIKHKRYNEITQTLVRSKARIAQKHQSLGASISTTKLTDDKQALPLTKPPQTKTNCNLYAIESKLY